MLKFIGAVAVIGIIGLGAGMATGVLNFKADASLTQKGHEQVKQLRESVAEKIRGQEK